MQKKFHLSFNVFTLTQFSNRCILQYTKKLKQQVSTVHFKAHLTLQCCRKSSVLRADPGSGSLGLPRGLIYAR